MKISKTLHVKNREEWQFWLEKNHAAEKEIWLICYKKHTNKPNISYDAAVEEALCYGWIDSNIQRIDDDKYARKFTPRKDGNNWSELNKRRLEKLINEGKVKNAGLEKINFPSNNSGERNRVSISLKASGEFLKALKNNKSAFNNFNILAPSYKKQFIMWINAAKREETKTKRIAEAVGLLERNEKLGMK